MLALAAATLHGSARAKLWDRLALAGRGRRLLLLAAAAPARAARLGRSYRDASEAASWPPLVLLTVFAAGTPSATARIRALRRSWIGAIPRLGAADLLREGIPEGPRLGRMLEELRRARFGGKTRNRGDELRRIRSRS